MIPHEVDPRSGKNHNVRANSDQKSRNISEDKDLGINTNRSQGLVMNYDLVDDRGANYDFSGTETTGYQRPGQLIYEEACEALKLSGVVDAGHIGVTVEEGVVTLDGIVGSREMKKQAEACVENISGVVDVQNNIKIFGSGNDMKEVQ